MDNLKEGVTLSTKLPWRTLDNGMQKSEKENVLHSALQDIRAKTAFNDIAMLDAKMMYVIASKAELEDVAHDFREVILDGLKFMQRPAISQLTYEDIIFTNPQNDMRTFTKGTTGESEALFYRGHQIIERHLNDIIELLKTAHKTGEADFLDMACQCVMAATSAMKTVGSELNQSDYQVFRTYYDENPYTEEFGPSGRFSTNIPHIDILLNGWHKYDDRETLINNVDYFPQRGMLNLRQSLNDEIDLSKRFQKKCLWGR